MKNNILDIYKLTKNIGWTKIYVQFKEIVYQNRFDQNNSVRSVKNDEIKFSKMQYKNVCYTEKNRPHKIEQKQ